MQFPSPLIPGLLVKRYKRFLADITLGDGNLITAHCANPGAMTGLQAEGARVWLSVSDNPKRKLLYSWELVEADFGAGPCMVGINTAHPNAIVAKAVLNGTISELAGYSSLRREVKYGKQSRVDMLLEGDDRAACYVEVKNVHLFRQPERAEFPDSVTARGARHLDELAAMVTAGHRAMMVYLIQCEQARSFSLAADIDPAYAAAFKRARAAGVEACAYICNVLPAGISAIGAVPIIDCP